MLIIFIGSKFQHITYSHEKEYFLTYFFRYNYTLSIRIIFIVIGLVIGYSSKLNPWLVGLSLIIFFPSASFIEMIKYNDSHNLFPFEFIGYFFYALPVIIAVYLGRFISKVTTLTKEEGITALIHELKTRYSAIVTYILLGFLGVIIIGVCSLFHFKFNNLFGFYRPNEETAFFFFYNYSNEITYIFLIIGLLLGYFSKLSCWLLGFSLYLIFPLSVVTYLFLGKVLDDGLFIEWPILILPTIFAVFIGRFISLLIDKIKST
ncbi:hypothetical protein D3C85_723060 [compost metagenome]